MATTKITNAKEKSAIEAFMYRYTPYWPLFTLLLVLGGAGAYLYLKFIAKPVYEISANLLVEDQNKGADESKILQALNITSNKIVDNEIEVVRSKELLKEVIDSLKLYAPVYESGTIVSTSAYTSSPISISLMDPYNIPEVDKIFFSYNKKNNSVTVEGKNYALNEWVKTSFGIARFSPNAHFKTASDKPLYFTLNDPKQVLDGLYNRLLVTPASKLSSVIILTLNDEVPQRGEDILNLLLRSYYRAAIDDKNSLASNTLSFVEQRIRTVARELDSIEKKMQQYRNQKGIVDLSEQGKLYLQNVGDNDKKMTDVDMQLAMLSEVEKYVEDKDNKIGVVPSISGVKDEQLLAPLLQKLYESQMQYERLRKTIPEGNPSMYSLRNEIESMRPTILENIRNQRSSLVAGRGSLSAGTDKFMSMLQSIPKKEKELLDISRQQAIKNDAYSFLLQKREETSLAYAAMVNNTKTINTATASFDPVSPKKAFVFLSALAAALLLGFAFVNLKEQFTNKVLFRSDIEDITSIPIVAEIMSVKGKQPIVLNHKNVKQLSCIEQFHQLRFAIGLNNRLLRHKKILVTSGNAAEGKSFISNNLAISLASSGKKVVVVDFDFRNPKTSALYQLQASKGLADFFERDDLQIDDIIYESDNPNLFLVPAGCSVSNPTELLLKKDLEKLFDHLESKFDFIVMDTAPVGPILDAFVVSEYCDAVLFVIRHGYTSKAMLESLQKGQKINAFKNMCIVFNGIKPRGFIKKGYGFGYGYGSNYMYGENVYQIGKLANRV
jgi:tyrosine-protein kinase Etk/Wzc